MNVFTQIRRNDQPIYLDYQATTPMDPRVLEVMMPYFTYKFGNPHSRSHSYGWEAEEGVEKARAQVAKLIGADEKEVIFTSGATESNNLAIRGVAEFYKDRKNHIVTTVTEHKCVLDTCRHLEQQGFDVTYLPVQKNGLIDLDAMNIDLMSISGHKIYGPKGIGALYVRRKPRVRLVPLIVGGGQERGFRSGTLPTPLCVGLGEAAEICMKEMGGEDRRLKKLQERMLKGLNAKLTDIVLNGDLEHRIPGNLNISFAFVEGESLMMGIKGLSVSSGSACTSASLEPSYVLRALGVEEDMAHTSLRIGLGRFTTEHEVDTAVDELVHHVNKLRAMSPLWEMAQEGIDIKSIEWAAH